jgi:hypothetical protein
MSIEYGGDGEAATVEGLSVDRLERQRRNLGLTALTAEGRLAIEWALAQQTPPATRLATLLELGEQLGSLVLPSADLDAWGRALARIDALAFSARLIEAQIVAGNTGAGLMLPDPSLVLDDC